MAVAFMLTFAGDGRDVLALYDQANERMHAGQAPPAGLIVHWAARTSEGSLRVVDLWESKADFEAFMVSKLGPTVAALDLPTPAVETFEVYNVLQGMRETALTKD